uniref:Uncharacterized protein n=1 Tax=Strombidium inclinatum TaxID=197538 RepID=A0A7S3IXF9_9SPIT|mmetsp:Transcript_41509/g.63364  ORF Transcript_41509/g.63364 Transcript_41509/m.63364 type:complete len:143 (+) Transcript_41509:148-576(+)
MQRIQSLAQEEPCSTLEISAANMEKEMDYFSRSFDSKHFNNAVTILGELKKAGFKGNLPPVHSWELYDQSFSFPRVRHFDLVEEQMNELEHYQDNLNTNISNSHLLNKFVHAGKKVQGNLNQKYHDGEFKDPATVDPWAEKE